jgi:uncharacterized protein YndB with AHSA1/START domain
MNPTPFEPGPPAEVGCRADEDRWTLVFVRDLRHPPEKVWAALTEPARLREWAPSTADRDLGGTGDVTLTMIDGDAAVDLAASVIQAEPPALLEYGLGTGRLLDGRPSTRSAGTRRGTMGGRSCPTRMARSPASPIRTGRTI